MVAAAAGGALAGLWFQGQKHIPSTASLRFDPGCAVFLHLREWLERYFAGENPAYPLPLKIEGSAFQKAVWQALQKIPSGGTATYGEISRALGVRCPRAVGGAAGRNPIAIIIPCHRVIGARGALTGYAGGLEKKIFLLELEKTRRVP
jgi:methylated-DNA-[protein]-cysteine S-methyltransferase